MFGFGFFFQRLSDVILVGVSRLLQHVSGACFKKQVKGASLDQQIAFGLNFIFAFIVAILSGATIAIFRSFFYLQKLVFSSWNQVACI